ncbi:MULTISPECIES: ATP-dependent DNA helicase RecG [unclassified Halanaerobium]|uniref:ATP-dependent DNA helicase RecG n=1 Tax=unclassified Halanaerobium TaxID=2641197 RepID=UPI000DF2E684|nr:MULTISPECIES: ATP-dependent DNA helicase RecG [unclassified Halanaerobium]RCW51426.1 ATP-dependent DNA helicase RecG [Halanaerobium sp. MA284_MarDTE_T2]RCW89215.1 ATP-dependent DNA helicase RecG [Halanaerobium sp. DL-01]
MNIQLEKEVQYVKGVGPKWAEFLEKLNIKTVKDLLYYFPREYEDRRQITEMRYASPGQQVNLKGRVLKVELKKIRKGFDILKVTFSDDTDAVNGIWFNQNYLQSNFKKGEFYLLTGKISEKNWRKYKSKDINNPVYEKLDVDYPILNTGRIVPIYSLTEGISQRKLRRIISNALIDLNDNLKELLPDYILKKYHFPTLKKSLSAVHFPKNKKDYISAHMRLAFEELFLFQLYFLNEKKKYNIEDGIKHDYKKEKMDSFINSLKFDLTDAQKRVWQEIRNDLERKQPMLRLLQGDVGSGKTIIAALALLETIANGYQGVFMAPTEILAEQHYLKFKELFADFNYNIEIIVGSLKSSKRDSLEKAVANGEIDLIIGTHALFQESINYHKIGLIVIDEQHRFGVEQRHKLKEKGDRPDLLIMTATPIPRSMAMLIYGDLDLSIIDEMPPGRKTIATFWRRKNRRPKIYSFVRDKVKEGRQAYIVCPLIEPSEEMPELVSAEELYEILGDSIFKYFEIALIHSQINAEEKKDIMDAFRDGKIDILVATTVIEVGVDVSNATIMVIENAERFGLAQLHQLRGRVGRGKTQSFCILISDPPGEDAERRLEIMTHSSDGFLIAEEDLKMRGPGEFFGTRQHGIDDLKAANLIEDKHILKKAREEALKMVKDIRWEEKYPLLKEKIENIKLKI